MQHEVVWNGTLAREHGLTLCGDFQQRPDHSWAVLCGPDREVVPNSGTFVASIPPRPCLMCARPFRPRRRTQKFCSAACYFRTPKSPAFRAQIGRGGRRRCVEN